MHGLSVLIVDDDFGDRKLFRRILSGSGLSPTVVEAETADAAYEQRDQAFDAIFLDYHLPMTTGLKVLSSFRKYWPRAAIFIMTGQGDEEVAKSAIMEGASDYLSKSQIDEPRLVALIKNGVTAARMRSRLEEQHDDLATFSEVLVHDFRAPIRAAAFLTQQISEDLESGQMEDALHGLSVLNASTLQMGDMLKSLSDHIRFDRDEVFEAAQPFDLLERALKTQEIDLAETEATVEKNASMVVPSVHCQPPQIVQVLQNLVANALKFSGGERPHLTLAIKEDRCGMVRFDVIDRGIGIPDEFRERAFEPFKRVPGTGETNGTGLGLATCKKVVRRHGGQIWCESTVGQGTKMSFTLPIAGNFSESLGDSQTEGQFASNNAELPAHSIYSA